MSQVCFLEDRRPAKLLNLSTFGAAGESLKPPPKGAIITVTLPGAGPIEAQIRWVRGDLFGCRFVQPLTVKAVMLEYLADRGSLREHSFAPGGNIADE
jgi:hypothetical protein